MTTPSGTELTDEQLNVMMADVIGWTWVQLAKQYGYWVLPNGTSNPRTGSVIFTERLHYLPQFSTSLDACATFEATMDGAERVRYSDLVCDSATSSPYDDLFACLTATPRQRCIAFLRMKGVL